MHACTCSLKTFTTSFCLPVNIFSRAWSLWYSVWLLHLLWFSFPQSLFFKIVALALAGPSLSSEYELIDFIRMHVHVHKVNQYQRQAPRAVFPFIQCCWRLKMRDAYSSNTCNCMYDRLIAYMIKCRTFVYIRAWSIYWLTLCMYCYARQRTDSTMCKTACCEDEGNQANFVFKRYRERPTCCTDLLFLASFIAGWVVVLSLLMGSLDKGDPYKLVYGVDNKGRCVPTVYSM